MHLIIESAIKKVTPDEDQNIAHFVAALYDSFNFLLG